MTNNTCGECKHLNRDLGFCRACGAKWISVKDGVNCKYFEQIQPPTNGDKIIAGGMRELAKAMVYGYRVRDFDGQVMDEMLYTWHLPNAKAFTEYNEAVDFLENWLNAPAEREGVNG